MYNINSSVIIGTIIRLLLLIVYGYLNATKPFIRFIQPEEVWLYKYPDTDSYVSTSNLRLIIYIFPIIVLSLDYILNKNRDDIIQAFKSLTLAYPLNGVITTFLKVTIGRPRPDFYSRCFPGGSGSDFAHCTGASLNVMNGRKSFPSGHSSYSFTCMMFMSMYIARKLNFRNEEGIGWKLCFCILPLFLATAIAISRTCDYHHHYQDAIAGSMIGAMVAYTTFKAYFPKKEVSFPSN